MVDRITDCRHLQPPIAATEPADTAPVYGSTALQSIQVSLDEGVTVIVHFAVHVSHRYKTRVGERRFALWFNCTGQCRYHRELPQKLN